MNASAIQAPKALSSPLQRTPGRPDESIQARLEVLENLVLTLRSMVLVDELTQICNRRGFMRCGPRLLEAAWAEQHGALLFCFELDNLTSIKDTAGHAVGDAALVRAAQVLRGVFRHHDIVGRLGGDEFAVLAASDDPADCDIMMNRLHAALGASNATGALPYLSLSMGVARFEPANPLPLINLMQMADVAMHGNKVAKLLEFPRPGHDRQGSWAWQSGMQPGLCADGR